MSQESPQSTARSSAGRSLIVDHSVLQAVCSLCQRILSPDNEATGDLETIGICGDCKFLLLEDLGTPSHNSRRRRRSPSRRRTRYSSSESVENMFSQQFSHMINLARQNQSNVFGTEDPPVEGDAATRLSQRSSSRTTPRGSRRWRRVLSDTDSDGFDNVDSVYAESELNVSSGRYRVFHGESDAVSFSTYGGESDASVDLHGFLESETFVQPDEASDVDSDTDIDPMHAGLNHWNSDDLDGEAEEEGEDGDGEWEEGDAEEDTGLSTETRARLRSLLSPSPSGSLAWMQHAHSPDSQDRARRRIIGGTQAYIRNIYADLDESELMPDVGNSGDYLDARGFEEILQQFAETDNTRRGAPPAAVSFVNGLPRILINEEHQKHDDLACAICKDALTIGTEVNQLPCDHLYHPFCILPWLSSRNSCPLCRYELPTDDKDYEDGKRNISRRVEIRDIHQNMDDDSSVTFSDRGEEEEENEYGESREPGVNSSGRESGRGRWLFLAAAPIVSLVGIVIVLWLGNLGNGRRGHARRTNLEQGQRQIPISGSSPSQRENRSRRWWSLF
ncbi:hypothetical protein UlMin_000547 [Ulmus minor]